MRPFTSFRAPYMVLLLFQSFRYGTLEAWTCKGSEGRGGEGRGADRAVIACLPFSRSSEGL